jgi:hypothetical protein
MRFLVGLIAIAALVVIALLSFGFLTIQGSAGSLPTLKVEGGKAPQVTANMATVTVGTENKTVEVPTVGTTQKTVAVPTLNVTKPSEPAPAGTATPQ